MAMISWGSSLHPSWRSELFDSSVRGTLGAGVNVVGTLLGDKVGAHVGAPVGFFEGGAVFAELVLKSKDMLMDMDIDISIISASINSRYSLNPKKKQTKNELEVVAKHIN
jgi:hypothetical protein